jgi:hypothetical protein
LPDHVFSTARLRGYRVLEGAGLGNAVDLAVLNVLVASRLWLPASLIEVAFRNHADLAISKSHSEGANWLFGTGGASEPLNALAVSGYEMLRETRPDGSVDDPVVTAARMARDQTGRDQITRDDVIAHLMLGFWVVRAPAALAASEERFDVFAHVAANLSAPLDDAETLARRMTSFLRLRNRIAHHEPVLFRAKHVFDRRTGEAKSGAALIDGLEGGLATFAGDALKTIELARTIAPPAGTHLHGLEHAIQADINPLR